MKPKNTGTCSLSLLQRIFPTQRSNPCLLHCRQILYCLSYREAPQHSVPISSLPACTSLLVGDLMWLLQSSIHLWTRIYHSHPLLWHAIGSSSCHYQIDNDNDIIPLTRGISGQRKKKFYNRIKKKWTGRNNGCLSDFSSWFLQYCDL